MTPDPQNDPDLLQALIGRWLLRMDDPNADPDRESARILAEAPPKLREELRRELDGFRGLADATILSHNERAGGRVFGYELQRFLGRGATGRVWQALDPHGGVVAIKLIHPLYTSTAEGARRLKTEAQAAALVEHPALVRLLGQVSEGTSAALVTELVGSGMTLADEISQQRERGTQVDARVCIQHLLHAARGVQALHEGGVLHLDIKPANLLVDREGKLRVTDFGLARIQGAAELTRSYQLLGTPAYMSPEIARGDRRNASASSDVFSLSACLFEMIRSQRPFKGAGSPEIMYSILHDEPAPLPRPLPGLTAGQTGKLQRVLGRAFEKDASRRYPHAGALADDLQAILDDGPVHGVSIPRAVWLAMRRHRRVLTMVAAMTLLLFSGLWVAHTRGVQRENTARALSLSSDLVNLVSEKPLVTLNTDMEEVLTGLEALAASDRMGDVALRAKLLGSMAGLLCDRGREIAALDLIDQGLELLGETAPAQRAGLYLVRALCLSRRGDEVETAEAALQALRLYEQCGVPADHEHAVLAKAWAWASLWILGRDDERKALDMDVDEQCSLLEKVAAKSRARGARTWAIWVDLNRLMLEIHSTNYSKEMLPEVVQMVDDLVHKVGADHPWVVHVRFIEAQILFRVGEHDAALKAYEKTYEDAARALGTEHPYCGLALCGQAQVWRDRSEFDRANELYAQSTQSLEKSLGSDNRMLLRIYIGANVTLMRSGRLEEAEAGYRSAIDRANAALDRRDSVQLYLRRFCGQSLQLQGKTEGIEELIDESWSMLLPDVPEILHHIAIDELGHTVGLLRYMNADHALVERVHGYAEQLRASVFEHISEPDQILLDGYQEEIRELR